MRLIRFAVPAIAAVLSTASACATEQATAAVTITQLVGGVGTVYAQLCAEAEFATYQCAVTAKAKADADSVVVPLGPVAPGRYAVSVFYDVDDDGQMARGQYGIPLEPIGTSNDAKGTMGPPSFADAAVSLKPGENTLSIAVARP
jgi:uncharacterized protein (DUF2141 family)